MFKLKASMPQAQKLAAQYPKRFEVGTTGWVTARFTTEEPLPKQGAGISDPNPDMATRTLAEPIQIGRRFSTYSLFVVPFS